AAGVVDPDVDAAECAERFVAEALDVSAAGHVGDDGDRGRVDLRDDGAQRIRAARRERELMAVTTEAARHRRADPAAGAGDDDRLHHALAAAAAAACFCAMSATAAAASLPPNVIRLYPRPERLFLQRMLPVVRSRQ